jgi:glycolate oxidase FAD binding subunit
MKPTTILELQDLVRNQKTIAVRGAGTKPALLDNQPGAPLMETCGLSGLLDYQPDEFTFSALAGTSLAEVRTALAGHGQYLPFDPPLVDAGATLGGAVASGLSGAGRYRYGGLRDFLLAVRFVDGAGQVVSGGGRVVKNAAGFDLPKLMVGSLGRYGVLVELSFKVFPRPEAYATAIASYPTLAEALESLTHLSGQPLELYALDLHPQGNAFSLLARLGGRPESLKARLQRLSAALRSDALQTLEGPPEAALWRGEGEFSWVPDGCCLVKAPLTPQRLAQLDPLLEARGALRHYSVGANLAWVAWPGAVAELDNILTEQGLSGLLLSGAAAPPQLGVRSGEEFARRVKRALDPLGKFPGA